VVGINKIPLQNLPSYIYNHGFISKNDEEGNRKISELISKSHFLLLPSVADCSPIVLSEANSFGVPCLTIDVGGIPTIIKNNINGKMFSINSFVEDCPNYITYLFNDYSEYKQLSYSSLMNIKQS